MSRIRSKDTRVELALRRALFAAGFRYRIHRRDLPGSPDIVFPGAKVAVFVDGDFWHGYRFEEWQQKLAPEWRAKIVRNMARDERASRALRKLGWSVLRIWEHEIEGALGTAVAKIRRRIDARAAPRA